MLLAVDVTCVTGRCAGEPATLAAVGGDNGSCVVCTRNSDIGLAFVGEPAWAVAGLLAMGAPIVQAESTVQRLFDGSLPTRGSTQTMTMRVCQDCATSGGFDVGPVQSPPNVLQP